MAKTGIFYATGKGFTKTACEILASELGGAEIFDIENTDVAKISRFELIILASSTYGDGELAPAWKDKLDELDELDELDFTGKKVALLGVGNRERHGDHFAESIVHFLPKIKNATLVGKDRSDYTGFNASLAREANGEFIGLVLDIKGDEEYAKRISAWAKKLA
ncbi:flavodoxin domain-containing protein [Campylobacter suis]|uniref:Flavodoxin n=1 Tax=Campylobacter suis TaxID=2790657 RepID=A0ABM8Q3G1_9BACT|nr:flavodoxin domain-containing protein [Campylobacter suis]CAD7287367.1 Flavodoxin [Campylobacter suis]